MQGKVEICGINTAKLEVLKNDEMTELLRRTKQGDMDARERLIRGNLRLVLSVLQRFTSRGENMDDLFQVGCIGLIKAIDNFDITQPVRFSTYGVPMIVGEIRRYLRDNSAVRVSRSLRDTAYKVLQARERLLRQSQREPTVEQLARELDALEKVADSMHAVSDAMTELLGTTAMTADQKMDESRLQLKLAAAEARDNYNKLSPREAASTMRARADEAMEAARRASQTARLNAAEAAKAVKLAAQGKAEQTTSLLQLEQLKDELAARAQVMQARTRRSTHLLGKGRMLRAYPKLKHGQNNRSLNSLLEQLEKEYPDYFDHNNTFGIQ